jgi:S-adenosylmethionine:tRNA ribosyltransferase-isomerase
MEAVLKPRSREAPAMRSYTLSDFDFDLPAELIAQSPAAQRTASRMLHVKPERAGVILLERRFADLESLVQPGDVIVLNDTRVLRSRLHAAKATGGRVELLLERVVGEREGLFQLRASHPPKIGTTLALPGGASATVLGRDERFFHLRIDCSVTLIDYLGRHGEVPLPPYIARAADASDEERYQTVYARHPGAVAAPTAGLHFDEALLERLRQAGVTLAYVTLHVGAGTFAPVVDEDLSKHRMHAEWYRIPDATRAAIASARARAARVLAVGTTSLRALESAADDDGRVRAGDGETSLFITPGYRFRVVDRLLTNFHLPRTTLLMLVSAFAGASAIRAAYAHAIASRFRFFSYGDAMFLERADAANDI